MHLVRIFIILLAYIFSSALHAETIKVAVASNFIAPIKHLSQIFEQETGHRVALSFGSSGKFYAQIKNGAPFHLFLSADQHKIQTLQNENLIINSSRFTYAVGVLVLWSEQKILQPITLKSLTDNAFKKIALANPKLAPYGAAAVEVLNNLNLTSISRAKWVRGDNIAQTYQFISSGNADIGFVAMSQLVNKNDVATSSTWVIPEHLYQPILQDAALLKTAADHTAAHSLLSYIQSEPAQSIIQSYGYKKP